MKVLRDQAITGSFHPLPDPCWPHGADTPKREELYWGERVIHELTFLGLHLKQHSVCHPLTEVP